MLEKQNLKDFDLRQPVNIISISKFVKLVFNVFFLLVKKLRKLRGVSKVGIDELVDSLLRQINIKNLGIVSLDQFKDFILHCFAFGFQEGQKEHSFFLHLFIHVMIVLG